MPEGAATRILRQEMVDRQIAARGLRDRAVLKAMSDVPRHLFVDDVDPSAAYGDHPSPIGCGQTISQPYITALMLHMASVRPDSRVLEIGTGSGYQTAILASMGCRVVSIDILPGFCRRASSRLADLGLSGRVLLLAADGYEGWEPGSPYDSIIVSAAPAFLPPALPAQLAEGGRLVLPVGTCVQRLLLVERTPDGFVETPGDHVRFVPLVPARTNGVTGS